MQQNELFDDFSDKFDGLENTFDLTATGAAANWYWFYRR